MSPAYRKMVKARAELVLEHPFFASLALRLEMREDRSCATSWSDGRVIGFNPDYIAAQPLDKVKGMQCHEVLHLACRHHLERGARDARLWNMACDYAINPLLLEAGLVLPDGYLDDPVHRGRSADAIYAALVREREEAHGGAEYGESRDFAADEEQDAVAGGSGELGGHDHGGTSGRADVGREGPRRAQGSGGPDGGPGENADPGRSGEVRDAPERSRADGGDMSGEEEEDEWRMAVVRAARAAQEAGNLPGALERLLASSLPPRIGWRAVLRRFLLRATRDDFSWVRPNRRYLHAGLYLPGLDSPTLEDFVVAVDVSGSVEPVLLEAFAAELSAVLDEFDTTLTVLTCDVSLTSYRCLTRQDLPVTLAVTGGGGTDFRPPFDVLEREGVTPACLVYFTDLQCSGYPQEPLYPVLWVTPGEPQTPPPFGEVVVMEAS